MCIHAECVRLLYYSNDRLWMQMCYSSIWFSRRLHFLLLSSFRFGAVHPITHTLKHSSHVCKVNRRPYWLRNGVCIWSIHFNGFEPNTLISYYYIRIHVSQGFCICAFRVFFFVVVEIFEYILGHFKLKRNVFYFC